MNTCNAGVSALITMLLLTGCSGINQFIGSEESIDYKNTASRSAQLSLPPNLIQAANKSHYRMSATGTAKFSDFQRQDQMRLARSAATAERAKRTTPKSGNAN